MHGKAEHVRLARSLVSASSVRHTIILTYARNATSCATGGKGKDLLGFFLVWSFPLGITLSCSSASESGVEDYTRGVWTPRDI